MTEHMRHTWQRTPRTRRLLLATLVAVTTQVGGRNLRAQQTANADNATDKPRAAEAVLARRVTVTLTDVSLKTGIDSLAHLANTVVQYWGPVIAAHKTPVSLKVANVPLGIAFERLLDGTNLRVSSDVMGNLVVVAASTPNDSVPHTGIITGTVVDSATGRGVVGATVKIAGTKRSTVSTDSGRFVLREVPIGDQLVTVKMFGYRAAERNVTVTGQERLQLRIRLVAAPNVLSGVVTTATGVQDRRTVGNDITRLDVDSIMQTAPIKNLTDLLDGRVPGLTVQHTSGVPGAPARLRLRGVTSGLVPNSDHSNDPILIVDGIRVYAGTSTKRNQNSAATGYTTQSGYDQIDPNSIATVEVFKGPSASALYGPDAANGVIVVTTKRGQAGQPRLSAAANYGITYMPGVYAGPGLYNFGHSIDGRSNGSIQCGAVVGQFYSGGQSDCIRDSLVSFQALTMPRLSLFGTGNESGGSVNASGGSGTLTYVLTGSVTHALGYLKMPAFYQDQFRAAYLKDVFSWMKRPDRYGTAKGTASLVSTPYPGLQLSFATSLGTSDQQQSAVQTNISELSGTYVDTTVLNGLTLSQYIEKVTSHVLTANNSLTGAWTRWAQLPIQLVAGVSLTDEEDEGLEPYGVFGKITASTRGYYAYARKITSVRTVNANGTAFPLGRIRTSVGFNIITTEPKDFFGTVDSLQPGVPSPSGFSTASQVTSSLTTAGWYVEPRLHLSDRFFVAPGFRIDNTGNYLSKGGLTGGGGFAALLPKMDFSWVAVDREGMRPLFGVLTLLRPRVALGVSGTQPDPTQLLRSYGQSVCGEEIGQGNTGICYLGLRLASVGNPDLRPERSRDLELGFDADLWANRLRITVSHDLKVTHDAIVQAPVAPSAGSSTLTNFRNLGDVQNTTTELSLTAVPIQTASMSWQVTANLTTIHNMVRRVNGTSNAIDLGNGVRAVPGYPLDGRWERPIIGYVVPTGRPLSVGDIVVGDSVAYVGSAQPGYTLPVQTSLSLWNGRVDLSLAVNYEHGLTQYARGDARRLISTFYDTTASPGQLAALLASQCIGQSTPPACPSIATNYGLIATVNVLRFSSLSLNYNVSPTLSKRLHLPRTSVQLQASNLGLWTNYRGKDPDVNGTPVGEAIEDNGQPPQPRSWGLRVTLGN